MSTFIGGSVNSLGIAKNVAIRNGIIPCARLSKLQSGTMVSCLKKQRNLLQTQFRYGVHISAKAAQQEALNRRPNDEEGSYLAVGKRYIENQKSSLDPKLGQDDSNSSNNPEELERKSRRFEKIQEASSSLDPESVQNDISSSEDPEELEQKSRHFEKIQEVPVEERDRAQRVQVIDRAAAAIAAARAFIAENPRPQPSDRMMPASAEFSSNAGQGSSWEKPINASGLQEERRTSSFVPSLPLSEIHATPGPDFWSWSPPSEKESESMPALTNSQPANSITDGKPVADVLEKERSSAALDIPFESQVLYQNRAVPSLPPLQSLMEVTNNGNSELKADSNIPGKQDASEGVFDSKIPQLASEIASVIDEDHAKPANATYGVNPDGSRWWKETGVEHCANGVICNWTVSRGVSTNGEIEWEEKFWEAYDDFDYKELGSEKSGRNAAGNVWREFWKEVMWQDMQSGLLHIEKLADKWATNGHNEQWQEKWWEHYDAAGHAEKWADKWCQIDLSTPLEAGHAHVWHERWGEKYDGKGGAMKYTDKWAERAEGGGKWSKWGDKWDEHFNQNSIGVRQGETWWEGTTGERWNRTWGEQHDGSGWIHKYGKSSSGEHWDTHEEQDTWYERYPHYGFTHCLENSRELRRVNKRTKPKL